MPRLFRLPPAAVETRRPADEIRVLRGALEMNPNQFDVHFALGLAAGSMGDCKTAHSETGWAAQHFDAPVTRFGVAVVSTVCDGNNGPLAGFLAEAEKSSTGFGSPYQLLLLTRT
jgi:hypothetical protein